MAHPDDDLLFLTPDLSHALKAGRPVTTVYVTSGDSGRGSDYWLEREKGVCAAYALMAGAADLWRESKLPLAGRDLCVRSLCERHDITLVFLRLPNRRSSGKRSAVGETALESLYRDNIFRLHSVDGSNGYSKEDLALTFLNLLKYYQPVEVRTQDYRLPERQPRYGELPRDHGDHWAVARLIYDVHRQMLTAHRLIGYAGYGISALPANVQGDEQALKVAAFTAYAEHDEVSVSGMPNAAWLARQYVVGCEDGGARID